MEQTPDSNGSIDKSRVLDVKPLRTLVPVFPNPPGLSSLTTPQPTPFVCISPTGPFPPGVQPFYPFLGPDGSQQALSGAQNRPANFGFQSSIPAPVPLNSFRTPPSQVNGSTRRRGRPSKSHASEPVGIEEDGYGEMLNQDGESASGFSTDVASSSVKRKSRSRKGAEKGGDAESLADSFLSSFKINEFDDFSRANGDKNIVATLLLVFDLIKRRLSQHEEASQISVAKRPDLKAGSILMMKGARTNTSKRVGPVPGIEIGDIFFFRIELCLVGLHAPSMAGIDYMSAKVSTGEEPIAVSIVSSGGYDDGVDDGDVLIYSGQGGVQGKDQKLERGNLALENSLHHGNVVRVIRGLKDLANPTSKIYVYDGLYKIQESWTEKNNAGCNVFKYKLVRVPGQAEAFSLWKSIQQWKDGLASRSGVILPDLTSGAENQPVTLVNDVDGEKGPAHFTYIPRLKYPKPFYTSKPYLGCRCLGGCQPGDTNCHCNLKNDGFLPYSSIGVLLTSKSLIYECGETCSCPPNCRSRMSQAGLKFHLEVFKTKNRGWGLRSWDAIRAGSFICEYAGDVINSSNPWNQNDDYIFDTTRLYEPLEPAPDPSSSVKAPFPLVISAKGSGNVARFMNHSCYPNVLWQPVLRESNHDSYFHVAFFAIRHIPPMEELTFDYGSVPPGKSDREKKKCFCGSVKCREYFY